MSNFYILDFQRPGQKIIYGKKSYRANYVLNQKLLFYYYKYGVQTRHWNPCGYLPCSFLAKSVSLFFWVWAVQNFISKTSTTAYKYHATSQFKEDLCTINDDYEFSKSFKCIYSGELQLKLEHSGTYATFLDLTLKLKMVYLSLNSLIKETNFHFSSSP